MFLLLSCSSLISLSFVFLRRCVCVACICVCVCVAIASSFHACCIASLAHHIHASRHCLVPADFPRPASNPPPAQHVHGQVGHTQA